MLTFPSFHILSLLVIVTEIYYQSEKKLKNFYLIFNLIFKFYKFTIVVRLSNTIFLSTGDEELLFNTKILDILT
jgi:hypothetical protein